MTIEARIHFHARWLGIVWEVFHMNVTKPRVVIREVGSWCIWTKTGRKPSFFHTTQELALAEAERLATKTPGKKFIVMQVVAKVHVEPEQVPA